jgi:hydroxyethylthiazole kinase-like uncharacterized protein yjeF
LKSQGGFVYVTAEEMAEADRAAIDGLGIEVSSLMENAGTRAAELARIMLGKDVAGKKVTVLVGRGNNGGDGLVVARHLHNWGAGVTVTLGEEKGDLRDTPAKQLNVVEKMGVRIAEHADPESELVVDALLGYGARGDPRGPIADLIKEANGSGVPIMAVDIPSGLDATTGDLGEPCIRARATVTFGFPKTGFLGPGARGVVGDLYVADISLPRSIYEKYSSPALFSGASIVRVW